MNIRYAVEFKFIYLVLIFGIIINQQQKQYMYHKLLNILRSLKIALHMCGTHYRLEMKTECQNFYPLWFFNLKNKMSIKYKRKNMFKTPFWVASLTP